MSDGFDEVVDTATTDGEIGTEQQDFTEQVETGDTAQVEQETAQETVQEKQERLFKQSELDAIIEKRLAKERQRHETETKTAAQQARDELVAKQRYMWHDKLITTEAEWEQALQEQELENKIRSQYSNVPDEVVNELVEGKRFREEAAAEKKAKEEAEAQKKADTEHSTKIQRECTEFNKLFKEENGRSFDWESEKFPPEVESFVKQGYPLDYAYSRYLVGAKRISQQTQQANEKNAGTSTGAVKNLTKPTNQDPFLAGFDSVR